MHLDLLGVSGQEALPHSIGDFGRHNFGIARAPASAWKIPIMSTNRPYFIDL